MAGKPTSGKVSSRESGHDSIPLPRLDYPSLPPSDEKHNEITYFQPLLDGVEKLRDVVVTADALHTQREHAHYLHGRGAHYVLTVKANQPKLHDQLRSLPWNRVRAGNKSRETANGREIERTIKCLTLAGGINFPYAVQAGQITRKSRPIGTRRTRDEFNPRANVEATVGLLWLTAQRPLSRPAVSPGTSSNR